MNKIKNPDNIRIFDFKNIIYRNIKIIIKSMFTKFNTYENLLMLTEIMATDKVDRKALNKIRRCFTQILTNFGFFSDLLFALNLIEAHPGTGIDTMATDGKSIAYSAEFVNKLSEGEVIFVIIHEIMHNANIHFARQGLRHPEVWNWAADYAINLQIDDMRKDLPTQQGVLLEKPDKILLDEKYRDMSAEQIYDALVKEMKEQGKDPGDGDGGDGEGQEGEGEGQGSGQGKSGKGKPGKGSGTQGPNGEEGNSLGGDIKKPGALDDKGEEIYKGNDELNDAETPEELEKKWQDIRNTAAAKNQGSGSATLDRWMRKASKPKINWKFELKKFVATIFDELDYAYSDKRHVWRDEHLPGLRDADTSSFENVVIAIDTSGSINDDTLAKFGAEMLKLFKMYSIHKCTVIWCDSTIPSDGIQTFDVADKSFKLDNLKPTGGGGTDFRPPFEWVQKNMLRKGRVPAFFIYFTDAYGTAPTSTQFGLRAYNQRVMWVITDNDDAKEISFGKKLYIDKMP